MITMVRIKLIIGDFMLPPIHQEMSSPLGTIISCILKPQSCMFLYFNNVQIRTNQSLNNFISPSLSPEVRVSCMLDETTPKAKLYM